MGREQDHSTNTKENLQSALGLAAEKTGVLGAQVGAGCRGGWGLTHDLHFSQICMRLSHLECSPVGFSSAAACRVRLPGFASTQGCVPCQAGALVDCS